MPADDKKMHKVRALQEQQYAFGKFYPLNEVFQVTAEQKAELEKTDDAANKFEFLD